MAVKFSQFSSISPSATTFLVGYDGSVNIKVPYTSLVGGSGTVNYLPKWVGATALGNSLVQDDGTNVAIGVAPGTYKFNVSGSIGSTSEYNLRDATAQTNARLVYSSANSAYEIQTKRDFNNYGAVIRYARENAGNIPLLELGYDAILNAGGGNARLRVSNTDYVIVQNTGNFIVNGSSNGFRQYFATNNTIFGGTVDAGYRVDVQGTFRSTADANINGLTVGKGGGSVASNTAFGGGALSVNTTGSINTAIGFAALRDNLIGFQNTAVGNASGRANTGNNNTYFGFAAGIVNTTGSENTLLGTYSAYALNGGSFNSFVGWFVGGDIVGGSGNTLVGHNTGRGITTGNNNTIIGAGVSGLSSSLSNTIILADGQGNQRLYINNSGNVGIGTTTPVTTTGFTALTINSPSSPAYGSALDLLLNGSSRVRFQFVSTSVSIISTTQYPINFWGNGTIKMSLIGNTGNLLIGTTTDAGFKLDVNGTARVQGNTQIIGTGGSVVSLDIFGGATGGAGQTLRIYGTTPNTQGLFLTYDTGSAISYIDGAYHATASGSSFGDIVFRSKKNATNTLAENMRIRGFDGSVGIGTSSPNASALLDVSSTTKGLLLPRMSGVQAEAIATPADGLVVYVNSGDGVTITSTGFWGRDAGAWVKLN